ncbi:MAG: helix-turn-helix transcriptional regulator [Patescibacteria group bacterium]|nr:helix-turn-helix transcriptional regulator [Patescibacteria group bacterium]
MTIGEFILEYREKNDITQSEFAKKSGLARSYIARLERGDFEDGSIGLATFIRLSKALGIPMYRLFSDLKYDNQGNLPPLGAYLLRAQRRRKSDV